MGQGGQEMELGVIAGQLIWGILIGVGYSLLAISFSLIFAAANTINFANGEFAMLGAYFCYTVLERLHGNILLAALVALLLCFVFGMVVERLCFRRIYKLDPVLIVIATIGISTILKNLVLIVWGSFSKSFPTLTALQAIHLASLVIIPQNIILLAVGLLVMAVFHLFMTKTRLGTAMRATAQNIKAASLVGINTRRTIGLTWAFGSLIAGVGGILIAFVYNLSIEMGSLLGIKGFASAVIGGFGNIVGAMFGGLAMGSTETLGAMIISFYYKDLIAFVVLIIILLLKPTGLFVRRGAFRRV